MNWQSHHFILYKYNSGADQQFPEGLRKVDNLLDQADMNFNATTTAVWQFDRLHQLPEGTSYHWGMNTALDLNYHVRNYHTDSILAAKVYLNIYTQPANSGDVKMFSSLAVYGGVNPYILNIPNDGVPHTFTMEQYTPNSTETWYFWILQAHTHKLGIDYDIFLRNPDGTKGRQVYEGFYNPDYTFNQGYYDYSHPPVLEIDTFLPVEMRNGLIHEATYLNNGPAPVGFGLTTEDEMFITYYQYVKQLPTGVAVKNISGSGSIEVFPNPASAQLNIKFSMKKPGKVSVNLQSISGKITHLLYEGNLPADMHLLRVGLDKYDLPSGAYIISVNTPEETLLRKLLTVK